MWALKLLLIAAAAYALIAAALFFAQASIIFPTRLVPPAGPLPRGAERLQLTAPDGIGLEGVHIPAAVAGDSGVLILGFAGNASNAAGIAEFLHQLYPEHSVAAFHYRGYAPSGGTAGAAALLKDAPLIHDRVRERFRPDRLVAVGISLGSGVAAGLAERRPLDGLVLVTPFDSLKAVARQQFPWLPVALLLRHDLDSAEFLSGSRLPVAIVAAERDEVIPPRRTEALRRLVPNLVFHAVVPGTRHNDIAYHPDFRLRMREALHRILAADASE